SSRRRHTRFSRDWSSDVCSSDLDNKDSRPGSGNNSGNRFNKDNNKNRRKGAGQRRPVEKVEPTEEEVQKQVRETLEKLQGKASKIGRASCRERVRLLVDDEGGKR